MTLIVPVRPCVSSSRYNSDGGRAVLTAGGRSSKIAWNLYHNATPIIPAITLITPKALQVPAFMDNYRLSSMEKDVTMRSLYSRSPGREMVESFCNSYYIPDGVHPTASGRDVTITQFPKGVLEKDSAPHITARQDQTVQVLSANKSPFRYPKCFLALVGLSLYYPFNENTYPAFERPDKTDMGLLDYIRTADPWKVQAVEVQKGGDGSGAGPDVSAPSAEENVVAEENVIPAGTYLDLMDPEGDLIEAEKGDAARKQPDKVKRNKFLKQSDTLPTKKLRVDHPSLASGTGGKSLASLRRTIPEGSLALGPSSQAVVHAKLTVQGSHVAYAPVYTAAAAVTSSRGKMHAASMLDIGGSSQLEASEGSADSFYEMAALNSEDAKRWYIPRWNITNDSLLDDGFS
ncbi:hypothetical protein Tco_0511539, partial [Tanacetum coccineum]